MSYKLLHEADTPEQQIAAKYDVPTFDDYKLGGRETVRDLTEFQDLVFTLVYAIHCGGDKP